MGKIEIGRVSSQKNSKGYKIAWDSKNKRGYMLSNGAWSDIGSAKSPDDVPGLAMKRINTYSSL